MRSSSTPPSTSLSTWAKYQVHVPAWSSYSEFLYVFLVLKVSTFFRLYLRCERWQTKILRLWKIPWYSIPPISFYRGFADGHPSNRPRSYRDLVIHSLFCRMMLFGDDMKILWSLYFYGVIPLDVVLLLGF
jgi:hypothetical protein